MAPFRVDVFTRASGRKADKSLPAGDLEYARYLLRSETKSMDVTRILILKKVGKDIWEKVELWTRSMGE